jgi:soluble lytic murein transglycosylase
MVLFGLYQNFGHIKISLQKVNQASRSSHARELLGRKYKGSTAQKAEKNQNLHLSICAQLSENLPPNFKDSASLLAETLIEDSEFYDFDPVLVLAMIKTESKYNPLALGQFGEIGLLQIKPDTAEWIANKEGISWDGPDTLRDPVSNVRIGMAYLNYLRTSFEGSANKYISAYNMGPRNVRRLYADERKPQEYTVRVMRNYKELYTQIMSFRASADLAQN